MASADFTIADVLAWARTKPADEAYDFCQPGYCAVAQFGRATGRHELVSVSDLRTLALPFALQLWQAAVRSDTFGQFADCLAASLPAEPLSTTWTKADAYLTDIEDVARERVVS